MKELGAFDIPSLSLSRFCFYNLICREENSYAIFYRVIQFDSRLFIRW